MTMLQRVHDEHGQKDAAVIPLDTDREEGSSMVLASNGGVINKLQSPRFAITQHRTTTTNASIWPAVLACTLFIVLGPAVTVINKYLVRDLDFHFPVTVGTIGSLSATVVTHAIVHLFNVDIPHAKTVTTEFYLRRVMPVGLFGALSICLGNAALLYLSISFIQMLKSFTPVTTMFFLWTAGLVSPTPTRILGVCGITVFSVIAVFGEAHFSFLGFTVMMLSVLAESLKMMVTQQLFSGVAKFNVIESQYYIGPAITLWSVVIILVLEARELFTAEVAQLVLSNPVPFAIASVLGAAVNFASFFVIKTTSTLNLKILVAVRGGAFVLLCAMLLGEHVSGMQAAGYAGALLSFLLYSVVG